MVSIISLILTPIINSRSLALGKSALAFLFLQKANWLLFLIEKGLGKKGNSNTYSAIYTMVTGLGFKTI